MPIIKAKATFRNDKLPGGVVRRGETVEVSASYAEELAKKNLAEIAEAEIVEEESAPAPEQDSEPEPKADPEPEAEPDGDPLEGVTFASGAAKDAAVAAGLTAADFEGVKPGGKTGYVTADVEALAE